MDIIFTEKELVQNESLLWGQWLFTSSSEEIQNKLVYVSKTHQNPPKWNSLYSFLQKNMLEGDHVVQKPYKLNKVDVSECIAVSDLEEKSIMDVDINKIDDLVNNVVHVCKQEDTKVNTLNISPEEAVLIRKDLSSLSEEKVMCVMEKSWAQLLSDFSKLRFCELLTPDEYLVKILCKDIILPWLCKHVPRNIEQLSAIISVQGEVMCRHLVAPLLKVKDSPFVEDLINLEDLMVSMTMYDWSVLLSELVCELGELEKWNIPVLTMIIEHSTPSSDDLGSLVQLMSFSGQQFSQDRDFGSLLVAVAKKLPQECIFLTSQLKVICNSYKGSLKFKVLKMLAE